MGYHVIDVAALPVTPDRPSDRRSISEATELENLGLHEFRVAPGEMIPLAMHYHDEQEEVLYVVEGEIAVETPEGEKTVPSGSAFVAEPGSPHRAFVAEDADRDARVLAIGAPKVDDVHAYDPEDDQ